MPCLHCRKPTLSDAMNWCNAECFANYWTANRPDRDLPTPRPPTEPQPTYEGIDYRHG